MAAAGPLDNPLKGWCPFKVDAPPGRYRLALGIRDPWTGRPAIALANDLPRSEGWTVLSTVEVGPAR